MIQALLIKLWRDSRWLLLGCLSVEFAFAMLRVWFVSRLDGSRFQQILELLPGNIQKWTPVEFDWIVSYAGRISFTFQEPIVHFCLFVWCVARGSDAISGEIDRGTMEMLLSQPLPLASASRASQMLLGPPLAASQSQRRLDMGSQVEALWL